MLTRRKVSPARQQSDSLAAGTHSCPKACESPTGQGGCFSPCPDASDPDGLCGGGHLYSRDLKTWYFGESTYTLRGTVVVKAPILRLVWVQSSQLLCTSMPEQVWAQRCCGGTVRDFVRGWSERHADKSAAADCVQRCSGWREEVSLQRRVGQQDDVHAQLHDGAGNQCPLAGKLPLKDGAIPFHNSEGAGAHLYPPAPPMHAQVQTSARLTTWHTWAICLHAAPQISFTHQID